MLNSQQKKSHIDFYDVIKAKVEPTGYMHGMFNV